MFTIIYQGLTKHVQTTLNWGKLYIPHACGLFEYFHTFHVVYSIYPLAEICVGRWESGKSCSGVVWNNWDSLREVVSVVRLANPGAIRLQWQHDSALIQPNCRKWTRNAACCSLQATFFEMWAVTLIWTRRLSFLYISTQKHKKRKEMLDKMSNNLFS